MDFSFVKRTLCPSLAKSRKVLGRFVTILIMLLASGKAVHGQIIPDVEVGEHPFGSYHETDLDSINLLNGELTLKIPLAAYPQRGDLSLDFFMSTGFDRPLAIQIHGQGTGTVTTTLQPAHRPLLGFNWSGNYKESSYLTSGGSGPCASTEYSAGGASTPAPDCPTPAAEYSVVMVTDPMGGTHQFAAVGNQLSGRTGSTLQESIDGGGLQTNVIPGVAPSTLWSFTDRKGTVYSAPAINQLKIEDRNGNVITQSTNRQINDSRGQPISWPTTGASLSACPQSGDVAGMSTSAQTWTPPGFGGGSVTYTLCSITEHMLAGYSCSGFSSGGVNYTFTYVSAEPSVLNAVVLPNGTMWRIITFNGVAADGVPNNDGTVFKIVTPTGATISYTLAAKYSPDNTMGPACNAASSQSPGIAPRMSVQAKSTDANDGSGPHVWTYAYTSSNGLPVTTVTDPLLNDTVHKFTEVPGGGVNYYETSVIQYAGAKSSNATLKQVDTVYSGYINPQDYTTTAMALPKTITTTMPPSGSVTQTVTYDSGAVLTGTPAIMGLVSDTTYPLVYGSVIDAKTSGIGTSAIIQEKSTPQKWQASSAYLQANLLDLLASEVIRDGSGHSCAETDYTYDDSAHFVSLDPSDTFVGHGAAPASVRGNLSLTTRIASSTPCTQTAVSGTSLVSETFVSDLGTVESVKDSDKNVTSFTHDPATHTRITATTNALGQKVQGAYDANTGLLTSLTDVNAQATTFNYDDINRLTCIEYPDGGSTAFKINDSSLTVDRITRVNGGDACTSTSGNIDLQYQFDGLARPTHTRLLSDPDGSSITDTTYDAVGRVQSLSNPYRSTSDTTYGITSFLYDALDRKIDQCQPDNSSTSTTVCVPQNSYQSWSCSGNTVTFKDETGSQWQQSSDSLGRLTKVLESNGISTTPTMETDYGYDALNNLKSVDQWGGPVNSTGDRVRGFTYDSLSRLVSSSNPESGTLTYSFSNAGVLCSGDVSSPCSKTDGRGISTTYGYDSLGRVTHELFSDGTPPNYFGYDGNDESGNPISPAPTNAKGRLSFASNEHNAAEKYNYDSVGRVLQKSSCIPGDCTFDIKVQARYDLAGNRTLLTNGAPATGIQFTYGYNSAGRVSSITSSWDDSTHPATLLSASAVGSYSPSGTLQSASAGLNNGTQVPVLTLQRAFDNRMRITRETDNLYQIGVNTVTSSDGWTISRYAKNVNVVTWNDSLMGVWNYGYDKLNRLTSASSSVGAFGGISVGWAYDAWGNRTYETTSGSSSFPVPTSTQAQFNTLNHVSESTYAPGGFVYDAAGNVSNDGVNQYQYDGGGNLCAIRNTTTSSVSEYIYDPEGHRVAKGTPSAFNCSFTSNGFVLTNRYVVGLDGEQLSELNGSGAWSHTNVSGPSGLLATYSGSSVYFAMNNWLGTKRAIVDQNGFNVTKYNSFPFGNALSSGWAGVDPSEAHFTGKERDTETGLDYFGARYMSSSIGRFVSPDPTFLNIRRVFNPQRWNMYSYGLNNPLTNIDPDGNEVIPVVYPNYMANSRGNIPAPTGHSGVVLVEENGKTHYFEYGRYPNGNQPTSDGSIREAATPDVQRDASGNITPDSMNTLLQSLSDSSGRHGPVEALVIPSTSSEDSAILAYLKAREAQNNNPGREKYSLWGAHNCGTLSCEALRSAGMKAAKSAFSTPYANFMNLWTLYGGQGWRYEPKEHVTSRIIYDNVNP